MDDLTTENLGLAVNAIGDQQLLSGRFQDFDQLSSAAAEWDLDFVQLDAGPSPSSLCQLHTPGLIVQRFSFGRTYFQRGASPSNMRTFGFMESEAPAVQMFGNQLTAADLATFQTGGEFDSVSPPGFSCVSVSLDVARLEEAFETLEISMPNPDQASGSGILSVDPTILGRIRQHAIALLDELSACPDALGRSDFMEDLILELPLDIALAFQSSKGSRRSPDSRVRDFAVRKAISFIEDHVDEPFPIRVLCDEVGVGWTTLVQGFREHFGMTPKAYVRALRLNGARKQLLSAEPKTRVADIANAWGFWHMGQFAADYRRLFLERPSETMKRVYAS